MMIAISVLIAIFGPLILEEIEKAEIRSNTIITSADVLGYPGWADSSLQSLRYHRGYVFNIT